MRMIFAALLVVTAGVAAARADYSAREMQSFCQPVVNSQIAANGHVMLQTTFEAGVCWGALGDFMALWKVHAVNMPWDLSGQLHLCVPENVSLTQIARIFDRYVTAHPQNLHDYYWFVLLNSLTDAFPCAQQ